ncbi:hypothetical protein GCM10027168_56570 [Streptomyces capparidis]
MTQTTLLTPTEPEPAAAVPAVKPGRLAGLRRMFAPVKQAHGVPKALLWTGFAISAVFVLAALFAPLIAPYDFDQYSSGGERFPKQGEPGGDHLFGTTVQSLDVLSRVLYGARTALEVMVLAVLFSLVIGVLLGLLSGYFGGWLDRILVLIMDALFAFPYLLLAIVAGFIFSGVAGGSIVTAALAITVVYIPQYFRVVRSSALSAREATYVEAARAMGAKPRTVISKYLFSNVIQSVPVITTMNAADAISTLAGLGFLGMGIEPTDAAEWGYDLERAIDDVGAGMWWTALFPGLAILLSILGFTLLGEGLNDVLNPSTRRRRITKVVIPPLAAPRRVVTAAAAPTAQAAPAKAADEERPAAEADPAPEPEPPAADGKDAGKDTAKAPAKAPAKAGEPSAGDAAEKAEKAEPAAEPEPEAEPEAAAKPEPEPEPEAEPAPAAEAEPADDPAAPAPAEAPADGDAEGTAPAPRAEGGTEKTTDSRTQKEG